MMTTMDELFDGSNAHELGGAGDLVTRLRSVGGYFDVAALEHVSLSECADEIERLRAALTEARRWMGDGEFSDGLHHDYWTPEYRAAVAMVDAALVPNYK